MTSFVHLACNLPELQAEAATARMCQQNTPSAVQLFKYRNYGDNISWFWWVVGTVEGGAESFSTVTSIEKGS